MTITDITKEEECCCSCKHNIREKDERFAEFAGIYCKCEIDGHHIGYVANFERVCELWEEANERKRSN